MPRASLAQANVTHAPIVSSGYARSVHSPSSTPAFAHALEQVAAELHPTAIADELCWTHTMERWQPGYHLGLQYGDAPIRAVVIIASSNLSEHPESGTISLHDPRVGAANVALPGLPWGRPAKIPPITGAAAAFPGWLAMSVAPLRANHHMTVWVLTAHPARPTQERTRYCAHDPTCRGEAVSQDEL